MLYKLISERTGVIAHTVFFVQGVIFVWGLSNDYFNKQILNNKSTGFDKYANTNLFGDTVGTNNFFFLHLVTIF